ncbi:hypothetical protein IQ06DRAFT_104065 [Phaeosphaeriaceae sp. SRC1lsM3a]|nr:hypothetical protein IQ06DRAFT_104065 [Stagonospora sp. SRC1lsM3a]
MVDIEPDVTAATKLIEAPRRHEPGSRHYERVRLTNLLTLWLIRLIAPSISLRSRYIYCPLPPFPVPLPHFRLLQRHSSIALQVCSLFCHIEFTPSMLEACPPHTPPPTPSATTYVPSARTTATTTTTARISTA